MNFHFLQSSCLMQHFSSNSDFNFTKYGKITTFDYFEVQLKIYCGVHGMLLSFEMQQHHYCSSSNRIGQIIIIIIVDFDYSLLECFFRSCLRIICRVGLFGWRWRGGYHYIMSFDTLPYYPISII